jgi:glucose/arabinose dehydrogenase/cytochrome c2
MRTRRAICAIAVGAMFSLWIVTSAPTRATQDSPSPWGPVVEPDFPFFSAVLDARTLGDGSPADNLTPRGLILNLGRGYWACFDIDLLRVSAIWHGTGITPAGMAQGSYHLSGAKAPEGQGKLPTIAGALIASNGLYPGWQIDRGGQPSLVDPRPVGPDPRELARGPIDPADGRFRAVRLTSDGVVLEYEAHGAAIQERIAARDDRVQRYFRIEGGADPLVVVIGRLASGMLVTETVPASPRPYEFGVEVTGTTARSLPPLESWPAGAASVRWPHAVVTGGRLAPSGEAFVVDRIPIPVLNQWRRNVRLADIAFLGRGRAAAVTFDGDVWTIEGLEGDLRRVEWRRFTSGLHEPLGLVERAGELFVFDRNGIWRLRDTDGNGEADRHELFSNAFVQTAETREFAMSIRAAPDGSFVIAKGGQEMTTIGRDNGSILRVSPDGRSVAKLGHGLRQPFASVDPRTGLVVASDQQGNYVPSTPLHEIRDGQYYGFLPMILPKEQHPAPIAEPIAWIPHAINASAAGQVWLAGARMGPLGDALVLIGYYRPELFVARLHDRASRRQAAVLSLTRDLDFAPLAGAVNPADGQLYVTGFQIWGTRAEAISGLARVRYTGAASTLPRAVIATDKGVLLQFDEALDRAAAADPANYSAEGWNYRRTAAYGSPHYLRTGEKGQDSMIPSSTYVSNDGKAVFVGIPDMQPVMQMRLGWSLRTADGAAFEENAYFTPHALVPFDAVAEGFGAIEVDLTPRRARAATTEGASSPSAEAGERVAARMGCLGCHSVDGTTIGRIGPSWKGLSGSTRTFVDRATAVADERYLRESMLEPSARVVSGFDESVAGMPSYAGVLSDAEIDALVLYIQSLK